MSQKATQSGVRAPEFKIVNYFPGGMHGYTGGPRPERLDIQMSERIVEEIARAGMCDLLAINPNWFARGPDTRGWLDTLQEKLKKWGLGAYFFYATPIAGSVHVLAHHKGMSPDEYFDWFVDEITAMVERFGPDRIHTFSWYAVLGEHYLGKHVSMEGFRSRKEAFDWFQNYVTRGDNWRNHSKKWAEQRFSKQGEEAAKLWDLEKHIAFLDRKQPELKRIQERWMSLGCVSAGYCGANLYPTHYGYEWGHNCAHMELGYRPYSGQVMLAFSRGAATQYKGYWELDECAVDFWYLGTKVDANLTNMKFWEAPFHRSTTMYNDKLERIAGPSPERSVRFWITAYYAGAITIFPQMASAHSFWQLQEGEPVLTPIGQYCKQFYDFTKKQPDRGRNYVPVALMLEHDHGWDPMVASDPVHRKDGAKVVWGCMPYESGDYMIENFFELIIPGWCQGFPHLEAFTTNEELVEALRNGLDTRPFETKLQLPTPWGDSFDVVLENCPLEVLQQHYRVVAMLGRLKIGGKLLDKLAEFVRGGGTLIVNAAQIEEREVFASLAGIRFTGIVKAGISSCWKPSGKTREEKWYRYEKVDVVSAEMLATTDEDDPLILRNALGEGEILFCTAHHMQSDDHSRLLEVSGELMDYVMAKVAKITVEGPPIEYLVNDLDCGGLIVTLINNTEDDWQGAVTIPGLKANDCRITELWEDNTLACMACAEGLAFQPEVPKFWFGIYQVEALE